jgi:hypothetical protein
MIYPDREVRFTMIRLRADAIELGFRDAAAAYGNSVIRLGMSAMAAELAACLRSGPAIDP